MNHENHENSQPVDEPTDEAVEQERKPLRAGLSTAPGTGQGRLGLSTHAVADAPPLALSKHAKDAKR